jgi:hypothetical protein
MQIKLLIIKLLLLFSSFLSPQNQKFEERYKLEKKKKTKTQYIFFSIYKELEMGRSNSCS